MHKLQDGSVVILTSDAGGARLAVTLEGDNLNTFLHFLSAGQPGAAIVHVSSVFTLSIELAQVAVMAFADSAVGKQLLAESNQESVSEAVSDVRPVQPAQAPAPKVRTPSVLITGGGGLQINLANGGIDIQKDPQKDLVAKLVSVYSIGGEPAMINALMTGMPGLTQEFASDCIRAFLESDVGKKLVGIRETENSKPRTGMHFIPGAWSIALFAVASLIASSSGISDKHGDQDTRTKSAISRICGNAELSARAINPRRLFC